MKKPELLRKSVGAALLIALGDCVLLKLGQPIGPFLFALGLVGVCYLGQNLFTGKCGFLISDRIPLPDLLLILAGNLAAGWVFGWLFSLADPSLIPAAQEKVASWECSLPFFIKACLCGVVMYVAVLLYRKGTPLGILFGIPLFIFCGFQHCIANVITLGVAGSFDWSLLIAVLGNFAGSLFTWWITRDQPKTEK
ncbi:MAG: formate/nitrite transporter family protein [Oscillospiraceae bacterium]|nr:formate/nitrite transporter family protein [Oscillospiraceae bacterium]